MIDSQERERPLERERPRGGESRAGQALARAACSPGPPSREWRARAACRGRRSGSTAPAAANRRCRASEGEAHQSRRRCPRCVHAVLHRRHSTRSTAMCPRRRQHRTPRTRTRRRWSAKATSATRPTSRPPTRSAAVRSAPLRRARQHQAAAADRRAPRATRHSPHATRHSPIANRQSPRVTRHAPRVTRPTYGHPPRTITHACATSPLRMRHTCLIPHSSFLGQVHIGLKSRDELSGAAPPTGGAPDDELQFVTSTRVLPFDTAAPRAAAAVRSGHRRIFTWQGGAQGGGALGGALGGVVHRARRATLRPLVLRAGGQGAAPFAGGGNPQWDVRVRDSEPATDSRGAPPLGGGRRRLLPSVRRSERSPPPWRLEAVVHMCRVCGGRGRAQRHRWCGRGGGRRRRARECARVCACMSPKYIGITERFFCPLFRAQPVSNRAAPVSNRAPPVSDRPARFNPRPARFRPPRPFQTAPRSFQTDAPFQTAPRPFQTGAPFQTAPRSFQTDAPFQTAPRSFQDAGQSNPAFRRLIPRAQPTQICAVS